MSRTTMLICSSARGEMGSDILVKLPDADERRPPSDGRLDSDPRNSWPMRLLCGPVVSGLQTVAIDNRNGITTVVVTRLMRSCEGGVNGGAAEDDHQRYGMGSAGGLVVERTRDGAR